MALDISNPEHTYRPLGFSLVGIFLLMLSGFVTYDLEQRRSDAVPVAAAYQYRINQSVDTSLNYVKNNFFDKGPGALNTAYVSELTESIDATFHYNYHASDMATLRYSYEVTASVQGTYALQGDQQKVPSVWTKDYSLVKPVHDEVTSRDITLNPHVTIPFARYKKEVEQFRASYNLPLNSQTVVRFTVDVAGTIGGTPFHDTRTSSVSMPLDQVVYLLAVKYDKEDAKQVVPQDMQKSRSAFEKYQAIIAGVLGIVGLGLLVFGLRKQIFKTPYQRELERIYRYHDDIIIKASEETNLADKHIVPVLSFDDMLNLEEELKSPIVASPAGGEATHFMIVHGDVVYQYTLGTVLLTDESALETITPDDVAPLVAPSKRKRKSSARET